MILLQNFLRFHHSAFREIFLFSGLKRGLILFSWLLIIDLHVTCTRLFLLLDRLFYPAFIKQPLGRTIFVCGLPRTATSFVQERLTFMNDKVVSQRLVDLLLFPSITQYRIARSIGWIGGKNLKKIYNRIIHFSDKMLVQTAGFHPMKMHGYEEDEILFLYRWDCSYLIYLFPHSAAIRKRLKGISKVEAESESRFYKYMLQRFLFARRISTNAILVSKNPCHGRRLSGLGQLFRDTLFIRTQRNYAERENSLKRLNAGLWQIFGIQTPELTWHESAGETMKGWEEAHQAAAREVEMITLHFEEVISK